MRRLFLFVTSIVFIPALSAAEASPAQIAVETVSKVDRLAGWAKPTIKCDPCFANIAVGWKAPLQFRFHADKDQVYHVAFGLCEGHYDKPEGRVLDLQIESKTVLTVDMPKEKGKNMPAVFVFPAKDTDNDGWINVGVSVAANSHDKNAFLNALWIFTGEKAPSPEEILTGTANSRASAFLQWGTDQQQQHSEEEWLKKRREQVAASLAKIPAPATPPQNPAGNDIDNFIAAKWATLPNVPAPALCNDATFVRRIYLDLIGRIPTETELSEFLNNPAADKRSTLIDALLARNEEYAANWVPFWEDALCSNGNHQGGVGTRENFRPYILESFKQNKPYDQFVWDLLTAKNFLKLKNKGSEDEDALRNARDTAQVFLGTALKCASCHNHFLNKEWTQDKFYGFADYFSDKNMEVVRCESATGRRPPLKFLFDGVGEDVAQTAGTPERLRKVAELIIAPDNPRFAKSIVNRLWRRCLGVGLIEPADDFRVTRAGSHPEMLEWLARDFMAHGYDIKYTLRQILNSHTYQSAYSAEVADRFDITKPDEPRYFRSPQIRRLTCEQFMDSVYIVTGTGQSRLYTNNASTELTRALGRPSTRNEVQTSRSQDTAVLQALELMNGEEFNKLISTSKFPSELAKMAETDKAAAVRKLFTKTLGRQPSTKEQELTLQAIPANTADAWSDILWGLLASPEFQYIK